MILGAQILEELKAHARASYPDECCGAVIEAPGGKQRVMRMRNVQDEMHASDPVHYPRTARTAYVPHSADLKAVYDLVDRGVTERTTAAPGLGADARSVERRSRLARFSGDGSDRRLALH